MRSGDAIRCSLLGLVLLLTGCFSIRNTYDGERLMTPGTTLGGPTEVVGEVAGGRYAWSGLFGFVDLSPSSGVELLEDRAEKRGAEFDGLTRIRIRDEADALSILVSVLTLGLVTPWWVEGEAQMERFVRVPSDGGGER